MPIYVSHGKGPGCERISRVRVVLAMTESEHRQIARDSLFVLADLRLDGSDVIHQVKVRNLSAGGLMAEGAVPVMRGTVVWVDIRNIGWVEGSVAWVQSNRFGVAFRDEIDPVLARGAKQTGESTPRFVKPPMFNNGQPAPGKRLRKV
jgi:hypothetical protein